MLATVLNKVATERMHSRMDLELPQHATAALAHMPPGSAPPAPQAQNALFGTVPIQDVLSPPPITRTPSDEEANRQWTLHSLFRRTEG
jgi:hypothetical protein